MRALRRSLRIVLVLASLAMAARADAQPAPDAASTTATATTPRTAPQGVAVLGASGAREDAFALARVIYGSSLRPRSLDELRARILAGDPAPPTASKDVRELAESRASIAGEDAASRRLLAGIAQQLNVQALLVVRRSAEQKVDSTALLEKAADAGTEETDAGLPPAPISPVGARLFLAETGDFDAARYEPDKTGWGSTAASLSPRFRPPPGPVAAERRGAAPKIVAEGKADSKPFYASPWLWAAVGAAVLIGGFFYFASQDTSQDPIHLQLHVPR